MHCKMKGEPKGRRMVKTHRSGDTGKKAHKGRKKITSSRDLDPTLKFSGLWSAKEYSLLNLTVNDSRIGNKMSSVRFLRGVK